MLLRQKLIGDIRLGLAVLQGHIRPGGPLNLTDINIHAEDFVGNILNLLNGWNLSSTSSHRSNFPCIDLIDIHAKIGVQVTSEKGAEKINKTQLCCRKELSGEISELYVFSLIPKQTSYALIKSDPSIRFDRNHILDFDHTLKMANGSSDNSLSEIHKYITMQMPAVFESAHLKQEALRKEIASCLTILDREVLSAPFRFEEPLAMLSAIKEIRTNLRKVGASRIPTESIAKEFEIIINTLIQCEYAIYDAFPYFKILLLNESTSYKDFLPGDYERSIEMMMKVRNDISNSLASINNELRAIDAVLY